MDYLNRLFIIILILYKDSGYEDRLMLTLLSLKLLNQQKLYSNKFYKINRIYKKDKDGHIKKIKDTYNKKIYIQKIKNNHKSRINSSLEKAMALYKEQFKKKSVKKTSNLLISTLKQNTKSNYVIATDDIVNREKNENNKKIIKAPVLILTLNILESFKGQIYFSNPIKFIDNITNKIIIKEKIVIMSSNNKLTIFIEGYLKTCIDCVEMTNNKFYSYIINTPFSSIKHIDKVHHELNEKTDYNKLSIEISNSKQEIKKKLTKNGNDYGYDECNLLMNITFTANIFKNDLITI